VVPKGPKKLGRCSAGRVSYSSFLPLLPLLTGLGGRSGAALGLTHLDVLKETHSPLPRPFLSPFLYKILSYRHKHTGTFMHRIHFHLRFLFQFAFSWLASGGQDSSHLLMPLFLVRIFFPLMQPYKQPLKSERE